MRLRHKKIRILDTPVSLGTMLRGTPIVHHKVEILNSGKINHNIHASFTVKQIGNSKHKIKMFVLTDLQFLEWMRYMGISRPSILTNLSKSNIADPQESLYSSNDAVTNDTFVIQPNKENTLFFIIDNSFSTISSKDVQLTIWEEWDEQVDSLDVVTTIPPDDTSLYEDVKRFISAAQNELKIITPHIDMFLIKDILARSEDEVKISIITRGRDTFSKSGKEAFDFIHDMLDKNHKTNDYIHSRLIIRDELEAIVSSADLNQDSMLGQYNAGILLSSPDTIQKLVNFFNQVWIDSKV